MSLGRLPAEYFTEAEKSRLEKISAGEGLQSFDNNDIALVARVQDWSKGSLQVMDSSSFATAKVLDSIYTHCGQNGLVTRQEFNRLRNLALSERGSQAMKPFGYGLTLFSAYNLSRFGVLSVGGQAASVFGLYAGLNFVLRSHRPTPEAVLST